jgi:hypothetical protein
MRRTPYSALPASLLAGLAGLLLPSPAPAPVMVDIDVYDNTTTPHSGIVDLYDEVGDEIDLVPSTSGTWTVTEFEVGYVGFFAEDGDEEMVVRFYQNDGPGGEPGTLIYQSAPQPMFSPDDYSTPETLVLMGLSEVVPNSFTWTVETLGISKTSGDLASVISYQPPTVGSSDELQYWENGLGSWFDSSFPPDYSNFYARVHAVPEPGVGAQLLAGSGMLTVLARRRSIGTGARRCTT